MNIKKLFFNIIAFSLIINAQVVYTKDQQDDNNKSQISINANNNDSLQGIAESNEGMWEFIEETLLSVTEQTQKIEFCLQTTEQIINAGKIKFNNQETKSQVLFNIKNIKLVIQKFFEYYTTQLTNKEESMMIGTCYNTAFIEYLLPVFQSDIKRISIDEFTTFIETNIEQIVTSIQSDEHLISIIETNETNLKQLISASDSVGLSILNKMYRYLESQPLPITGQPVFSTLNTMGYWSGIGLLLYATGTFMAPQNFKVPYLECDLPLKEYIGSSDRVSIFKNAPLASEKAEAAANFTIGDGLEVILRDATESRIVVGALGIVTVAVMNKWKEIRKTTEDCWGKTVNYLRGEINTPKNSQAIPKAYFTDMIGGEHLEKLSRELTDYLKNPTRYERAGITPSTGYLLVGPSQTGKSFFAKALKTMIDKEFEDTKEQVKFYTITAEDVEYFNGFTRIFEIASQNAPCILFIDELDMFGARRDRHAKNTQELLTAMNGIDTDSSKKVIVIAATNRPEELDFALKQKGRLGTTITFDLPTYECRKAYFEMQLQKKNIVLNQKMIETIAQETNGQTYNMIDDIIRQALQLATFETRPVTENDFESTLDREIRKIKPTSSISTQEKELVATYQAGQAAARHLLGTDQQIVKITVNPVDKATKSKEGFGIVNEKKDALHENHELLTPTRVKPTRLGFVFTMSKTNNQELISDNDQEKELMALLGGQAALEIITGTNFNGFGKEDRAKVIESLEKKFSQGTPITNEIRLQALSAKEVLYQKVKLTLEKDIKFIKVIRDELITNNTINTKQWTDLITNYTL